MSLSNFAEMLSVIENLPSADEAAVENCRQRDAQLTKPPKSLGRLEAVSEWHAAWGRGAPPQHPRLAIFAANHGIVQQGVSAFPQEVTHQMVANFATGGACVNQLCGLHDMDLRVYEMNLEQPSEDFSKTPAMSEEQACVAMAYGMSAVEEGVDFLCLGEMGIGNTTVAAALCHALYGGKAEDWVGRGTGLEGDALKHKVSVVADAVALHSASMKGNALEVLRHVGGFEICAMAGAIIAARMGRVPVLLDGYVCCSAAAVLSALGRTLGVDLLAHCLVGHLSAEPGHKKLCQELDKQPLLHLDLCLGEGSGAVLAFGIVRGALASHFGMATFGEAGVSEAD